MFKYNQHNDQADWNPGRRRPSLAERERVRPHHEGGEYGEQRDRFLHRLENIRRIRSAAPQTPRGPRSRGLSRGRMSGQLRAFPTKTDFLR